MSDDQLNTFLQQFSRAMFDPSAPLPDLWPTGAMGVFLIFVTQIGLGIPSGVLRARDLGINPLGMAGLYAASDVILAFTVEPMLILLRWLGDRVEFIGRLGNRLAKFSGATGLSDGKVRGPLGLILFSFAVSPGAARAASETAGHGFVPGWTLAIIGDMFYFTLIMASTLWVSSVFGDQRLTVGIVLIGGWVLPLLIRRMRRETPAPRPASLRPRLSTATTPSPVPVETPMPVVRKSPISHNGRRRRPPNRSPHR